MTLELLYCTSKPRHYLQILAPQEILDWIIPEIEQDVKNPFNIRGNYCKATLFGMRSKGDPLTW